MTTTIALLGAGGKMGRRITNNMKDRAEYRMLYVEVSQSGVDGLREIGLEVTPQAEALNAADVVVLAVPDVLIGRICDQIVPGLRSGAMVIGLDPAAGYAGVLPERADITYFITHPCHPPIFNDETDLAAKKDYFGGVAAKQHIVNALMQGPETAYALGDEIARTIWAPVMRSHRVTVEQMALLEPGLSETVCATLLETMREAMDDVVGRGVPYDAARDFLLGHMNVLASAIFKERDGVFSDACNKAIEFGKPVLMQPDWKRVFEPEEIAASIRRIT